MSIWCRREDALMNRLVSDNHPVRREGQTNHRFRAIVTSRGIGLQLKLKRTKAYSRCRRHGTPPSFSNQCCVLPGDDWRLSTSRMEDGCLVGQSISTRHEFAALISIADALAWNADGQ